VGIACVLVFGNGSVLQHSARAVNALTLQRLVMTVRSRPSRSNPESHALQDLIAHGEIFTYQNFIFDSVTK
jgi:hypothetical protein